MGSTGRASRTAPASLPPRWTGCTAPAAASSGSTRFCAGRGSSLNRRASGRCCRMWTSSARCTIWKACAGWWTRSPGRLRPASPPDGVSHVVFCRDRGRAPHRRRLARGGRGGGARHRYRDLGQLAAPGRQPDGGDEIRPHGGLGLRRLHRGRGRGCGDENDRNRRAAASRFRRHQRARVGGRARLRRQGEGVRGEAGMTPETLAALARAREEKRPVVLATRLSDGAQHLLPDPARPASLNEAAARALREDASGTVKVDGADWFLQAHNPPLRLIVVGAVHIAQGLVPFATGVGFAVTVVDPRRAFASDERFPNVTVRTDWPDEALDALKPDARTAVVTLTHDPKLDDPALDRALRSDAFYIGALGSRRTHNARLQRLRALGHDEAALARIRGPVGLDLEAVTAPEIGLSIAAELVAVRRGSPLAARQQAPQKAA